MNTFWQFENRWLITATLRMKTALSVGSRASLLPAGSDLPVIKTPERVPFIPGSSLKGVVRTYVERVLRTLDGMHTQYPGQRLRRMGTGTPEKLKPLGQKLRALSQALHLSRPREVMRIAHDLLPLLEEARTEFDRWAKPFALLARQIRNELEPLAFDQSDTLSRENLEKQLGLVEHYLKKGLVVQAVTLAREWVVSYVLLCRGSGDWLRRSDREEAEQALRDAAARLRGENAEPPAWFGQLPHKEELGRLWNELGNLRNDLANCAMSADARSAHAIGHDAQTIPQRIRALLDSAPDVVLPGARVVVDLRALYQDTAGLDELPHYIERAKELAGEGNEVVLTGQAPIWMYLAIAHALHGKARRLLYTSPVTGEVSIFDHTT